MLLDLNWYALDANVTNGTNYWWNIPVSASKAL